MFISLFSVGWLLFALHLFVPTLRRSWKTGVWVAQNNEWTRSNNPKLYWSGMVFGLFNILVPLLLVFMLIRHGVP
jgi:hypothetical protein